MPYPYPTFRIAESTGGLAMEAPALIWIPDTRGTVDHPFLISHETAHQWWYAIVGNDQSTSAFADEAMADYFSRKARRASRASRVPRPPRPRDPGLHEHVLLRGHLHPGCGFLDELRKDFGDRRFKRAIAPTRGQSPWYRRQQGAPRGLPRQDGHGVLKRYPAASRASTDRPGGPIGRRLRRVAAVARIGSGALVPCRRLRLGASHWRYTQGIGALPPC